MQSLSDFANSDFANSNFANINTEHWLQLDIAKQEEAWQLSRHHSNPLARYNAYLNCVCLSHLLDWVQEWLPEESGLRAQVFPSEQSLPSILEIVNGTAIKVGETRIVLVPTETIELEELRVPQEWIDINSWAADYYILVQIDLDEDDDSSMRLYGFTTHRCLKNQGKYNQSDRTYSLPIEQLTENFISLFATLGLNWQERVPPGVTLSSAEAQNLVQTLGDPSVYSPRLRLDVPFAQWAALLEHGGWRQRLYEQRQSQNPQPTPLVRLSQWLEQQFDTGWQSLESLLSNQTVEPAWSFRAARTIAERAKSIDFGRVLLVVSVTPTTATEIKIVVAVQPSNGQTNLPAELELALLDEDGASRIVIEGNSANKNMQLQFDGERGEKFSIKLTLGDVSVIENFVI